MPQPIHLDHLAALQRRVLKDEPATLVEQLGEGESAVVRKTYRNRGLRLLQTFWRQSRGKREYRNLLAAARTGVATTDAVACSEQRRLGFVTSSTLVTRYLPDSRSLKQVLADLPAQSRFAARRRLAVAMGRLVAALHRGGFLWCTAMPRNVLVLGDPAAADLAVCDVPAGIEAGAPLHGTRLCLVDLFDGAFSPSRRLDFSAPERLRWLLGYCGGDRASARGLWRSLARRTVFRHDLHRALAMLRYTYILWFWRRRRTTTAASAT